MNRKRKGRRKKWVVRKAAAGQQLWKWAGVKEVERQPNHTVKPKGRRAYLSDRASRCFKPDGGQRKLMQQRAGRRLDDDDNDGQGRWRGAGGGTLDVVAD